MIAGRVLGAVGAVVDWSLIHLLAAISDRVEGRGADCYRRADALADMEAGADHLEPGDLAECPHRSLHGVPGSDYWYCNRCGAAVPQIAPEPSVHGFSGECPTDSRSCGCGRSAAVTTPAADNTTDCGCGSGDKCPDPIVCPDAQVTAALAEDTEAVAGTELLDAIVALWDYHKPTYIGPRRPYRPEWECEGCWWTGRDIRAHTLHRLALVADMKNATHRIQEQLGGAS